MVKDDDELEYFQYGLMRVSGDPSIFRLEQMILRLLELIEKNLNSGTIKKSGDGDEMSTLSKNIKKEIKKNRHKNTGMKGSDFLPRS